MRTLSCTLTGIMLWAGTALLAQSPASGAPPSPAPRNSTQAAAQPAASASATTPAGDVDRSSLAPANPAPLAPAQVMNAIFRNEQQLVRQLHLYQPRVETYVQTERKDNELGEVPTGDHYFLGWADFSHGINEHSFMQQPGLLKSIWNDLAHFYSMDFLPRGFLQMIVVDQDQFDPQHYTLTYERQQFLGDVRCLVFDVTPRVKDQGKFQGRIWVEDQGYHIVRFNGTYTHAPVFGTYFHFDSWRINAKPGLWLPAYIYSEESDKQYSVLDRKLRFRSQTRLWGYDRKVNEGQSELASVLVQSPDAQDQSRSANDASPVEAERMWQREAEDNVLNRLQKAGLIAPPGPVDKILEQVVTNLEVTNNLDIQPAVRCRVLLTTPLESFTVGHTIVISRGLLDVLPDEPSLAMMLAHELGHIVLDHGIDTKYAFFDRMQFPDQKTFRKFDLAENPKEEAAADKEGLKLLENSPYKNKLANAGLFLRALANRAPDLPALVSPHLGNKFVLKGRVERMDALMQKAPQLQTRNVKQIAALPLGSRIKMNPWNDDIQMIQAPPVALLSAREKMPFEVTPFMPHLSYIDATQPQVAESSPQSAAQSTSQAQ